MLPCKLPFRFESHSAALEALPLCWLSITQSSVMPAGGPSHPQPHAHSHLLGSLIQAGRSREGGSQHVATICRVLVAGWVVVQDPSFLSWWRTPSYPHTTRISHTLSWKVGSCRWFPTSDCVCLMGCQLTNVPLLTLLACSLLSSSYSCTLLVQRDREC